MKEICDFSCWVIKYDTVSIYNKRYRKGSIRNPDDTLVALLWNHIHNDPSSVLGIALLEHREDGIFAYCTLHDTPYKEGVLKELQYNRGSLSLSPYVSRVEMGKDYINKGTIVEVSLVFERVDPGEAYYPVLREEKNNDTFHNS